MSKPTDMIVIDEGESGFSLVEIGLALLVVAMGLLILMSLFPAGLKEVETAVQNTRTAMFADSKFNQYQASASLIEQANWFTNDSTSKSSIFEGIAPGSLNVLETNKSVIQWKYYKQLNNMSFPPVWRVRLEIKNGPGPFIDPVVFYTELIFGAPPT